MIDIPFFYVILIHLFISRLLSHIIERNESQQVPVVGAGSVVTDSLDNYSIVVGTPAKKIKDRREKAGTREV